MVVKSYYIVGVGQKGGDFAVMLYSWVKWRGCRVVYLAFAARVPYGPSTYIFTCNKYFKVAVYSVFHLKRPNKIKTLFHVNLYLEGPYRTLSLSAFACSAICAIT